MNIKKAQIDLYTDVKQPEQLQDVAFVFNPGERSIYIGADNTSSAVQRGGWLGIQSEPFKGWQSAYFISVTGAGDSDLTFEVQRNFYDPVQEEDWLWFPGSPQTVES